MAYISHYTGDFISDQEAFEERAAFRALTWKGTAWGSPAFGADVVPFLLESNLTRDVLQEARGLVEGELGNDNNLYQVQSILLQTQDASAFMDVDIEGINTLTLQVT